MTAHFALGDISVDVVLKDIKNVHLGVYPPAGRVRISAPSGMKLDTIRVFAISKLAWIKQQQSRLRGQARETPREYLDRESHHVWEKRTLLGVAERDQPPSVVLKHDRMILTVRPGTGEAAKAVIVAGWYREQLRAAIPDIIAKWEPVIGVRVTRVFVQQMKTKWGSCNPRTGAIRLNTDLAKKPKECLEYVVVHEMIHLREATHNAHFVALMDRFVPQWQFWRQKLNRLPVCHSDWAC